MRYYENVPDGHIEDFDAFRSLDDLKAYCDRTGREYRLLSNGNAIVHRDMGYWSSFNPARAWDWLGGWFAGDESNRR